MLTSRLSAQGQITVPKQVRKAIGLEPGDRVAYEVRGRQVILRRLEPFDAAYHAAVSDTLDEWSSEEDEEAFGDL